MSKPKIVQIMPTSGWWVVDFYNPYACDSSAEVERMFKGNDYYSKDRVVAFGLLDDGETAVPLTRFGVAICEPDRPLRGRGGVPTYTQDLIHESDLDSELRRVRESNARAAELFSLHEAGDHTKCLYLLCCKSGGK